MCTDAVLWLAAAGASAPLTDPDRRGAPASAARHGPRAGGRSAHRRPSDAADAQVRRRRSTMRSAPCADGSRPIPTHRCERAADRLSTASVRRQLRHLHARALRCRRRRRWAVTAPTLRLVDDARREARRRIGIDPDGRRGHAVGRLTQRRCGGRSQHLRTGGLWLHHRRRWAVSAPTLRWRSWIAALETWGCGRGTALPSHGRRCNQCPQTPLLLSTRFWVTPLPRDVTPLHGPHLWKCVENSSGVNKAV